MAIVCSISRTSSRASCSRRGSCTGSFAAGRRDFALRFGIGLGDAAAVVYLAARLFGRRGVACCGRSSRLLERDHPGHAARDFGVHGDRARGGAQAVPAAPRRAVAARSVVRRRAILSRCFDPRLARRAESEFWPNFIAVAHARGVPVALVNGKMSAKSFRVHARTRLVPRVLSRSSTVLAVQTEEHAQRLAALGVAAERDCASRAT